MKILFLARRFYPDIGGVEKHVYEISKRLIAQHHEVAVITETQRNTASKKNKSFDTVDGIRIYRMKVGRDDFRKKIRIWKWFWENRKLIEEADIIHCHDVFFWYLPLRFLYPDKPVYTTFHGYESYPIKKRAIIVRKISEKLSWGNICVGDFIKKWYHTKPDFVTYGAVDIPKKISTKKPKKYSAIFFGRLDDQTSILTYVKAYELLKKKYPQFEMLVVGDGKYKKQISKKVKVIGFQKNPEKLLSKYHFVFVSRYLSIHEAMAAKRPVIAVYDNPVKEDYLCMTPYASVIAIESKAEYIALKVMGL